MPRTNKIEKILIANRGEIAIRILRACREMGIKTVAVYSEVDAGSLPVRLADQACHIGPSPASESYLNIGRIIDTAIKTGADALHPGYGFLSENPDFARECIARDIIFIGPDPNVIHSMGEKTVAKQLIQKAGIPTIPGVDRAIIDLDEARKVAEAIGYPLILKAAKGGGGRGMRIVRNDLELSAAFRLAKSEALAAFGSDAVFMEKYIVNPRHIEFQILADKHGNVVHLGERDCTLQRRHQKLLEEAPSPFLNDEMRKNMGEAAVAFAKAANYQSAGTVEFLIDSKNNFYFMEMNTRIQVEHPVTEMVTGVDIVKEQIYIAQGQKLKFKQSDVKIIGWTIQCRINAEDPFKGFIPNPGRIESIRFPFGSGIRVDTAVFDGYEIPRQYDSLIAKIIAHGQNRQVAISRMDNALSEMKIKGIKSTKEFHLALMRDDDFKNSKYDTSYIDERLNRLKANMKIDEQAAAIATAVDVFLYTQKMHTKKEDKNGVHKQPNAWRLNPRINRTPR
jgi:acetyl-CoA carboxylase biotin carboxylase subunit